MLRGACYIRSVGRGKWSLVTSHWSLVTVRWWFCPAVWRTETGLFLIFIYVTAYLLSGLVLKSCLSGCGEVPFPSTRDSG